MTEPDVSRAKQLLGACDVVWRGTFVPELPESPDAIDGVRIAGSYLAACVAAGRDTDATREEVRQMLVAAVAVMLGWTEEMTP